jgi:Secretion system C-terminal sorting domain
MQTIKNNIRKKAPMTVVMVVMFFMSSFQEVKAAIFTPFDCHAIAIAIHNNLFNDPTSNNRNTTAVASFVWNNIEYVAVATNRVNMPAGAIVAGFNLARRDVVRSAILRQLLFVPRGNRQIRIIIATGTTDGLNSYYPYLDRQGVYEYGIYQRPATGVHAEIAIEYMINRYINPGNVTFGDINIAANRRYCIHCGLYLTRNPGEYNILPNFTNLAPPLGLETPRPYTHTVQLANRNPYFPRRTLQLLALHYFICNAFHGSSGIPRVSQTANNDLLTEDNHNHLEGEDLEKEPIEALETNAEQKLAVFPNPILDNAIIKCFDCTVGSTISIYDITGNLKRELQWKDEGGQSMPIDLSSFTKGIYLLRTENPNGESKTRKLIKN